MVVELLTDIPVKLVRGSYQNIKITTPEAVSYTHLDVYKRQVAAFRSITEYTAFYGR